MKRYEYERKKKNIVPLLSENDENYEEENKIKRKHKKETKSVYCKEISLNFLDKSIVNVKIVCKNSSKIKLTPFKRAKEIQLEFLEPVSLEMKIKNYYKIRLTKFKKLKELNLEFLKIENPIKISIKHSVPTSLKPMKKFKEISLSFITQTPKIKIQITNNEKLESLEKSLSSSELINSGKGGGDNMENNVYPRCVNFGKHFSRGTGSPRIIITNVPMVYSFLSVELYRELIGNYPKVEMKVIRFKDDSESNLEDERNIDQILIPSDDVQDILSKLISVEVGGKVSIILIEENDHDKKMRLLKEIISIVKERIEKSSLEKLGFLIIGMNTPFEIKERPVEEDVKKILYEMEENWQEESGENIKEKIENMYLFKIEKIILSLKDTQIYLQRSYKIDTELMILLKKRQNILEKLKEKYGFFVKRNKIENDELGDTEQYPWKVAVVKCYLEKISKNPNESEEEFLIRVFKSNNPIIQTEKSIADGEIIPDVIVNFNGGKEYIEIETLISTYEPLKKIDESVEKYFSEGNIDTGSFLTIVVKPETAILHFTQLKKREKLFRKIYRNRISIKILCFENSNPTLYTLQDFENKLKSGTKLSNLISGMF